VASHPEQGWSLLCNGIVVFDDMGELLPDGRAVPPAHTLPAHTPPAQKPQAHRLRTLSSRALRAVVAA
jgi:Family of unknown function (DUF5999)